jgi:undecaprenyl diphosphate synthase
MSNQNTIKHISFVPDANRRWAKKQGLTKMEGHTQGAKNLRNVAQEVLNLGIPYMTIWGLSTENLKNRSKLELNHLFSLFSKITNHLEDFFENGVRLNIIGNMDTLPKKVVSALKKTEEKTQHNKKMVLTLAINYGGRDEIVRAIRKIIKAKIKPEDVTEEKVNLFLDTAGLPEIDLVVRTGCQKRLSGWLPWQTTYSELYFTDTFWPDFDKQELQKAIKWFNEQKRNKGK